MGKKLSFQRGFTIIEVLVALAVLATLVVLLSQLFEGARLAIGTVTTRLDADAQARGLLDRMAIDFAGMVRRADVDYYLKSSSISQSGNDQMAFYSEVTGYFQGSALASQSPLSLVAYRVNQQTPRVERLGIGLQWNGAGQANQNMAYLPITIQESWAAATDSDADPDYEVIGPDIFRFEYYYILQGAILPDGTVLPSIPSDTPWDTRIPQHTTYNGLRDVTAIVVTIAVIDPKSRALAGNPALEKIGEQMNDFTIGQPTGSLMTQWQAVVANPPAAFPKLAATGIRIYQRHFYLDTIAP